MKNKIIKIGSVVFLNLIIASNTFAQVISFPNPIKQQSITELVNKILSVVIDIGAIVAVFFVIYSGFLFVKAQGNPGELEKAKKTFLYTIIGGVIILGAFVISEAIQGTVDQIKR